MAFQSARGGNLVVTIPAMTIVPVAKWSASWQVSDVPCDQADSDGGSFSLAVKQNNSWEWRCARDDTYYPEAVGFNGGQLLPAIYFTLGSGSKADLLTNTLVTEVAPECDAESGEVVRVTIRGKGGTVKKNQPLPYDPP
jgi:hypothetical protein